MRRRPAGPAPALAPALALALGLLPLLPAPGGGAVPDSEGEATGPATELDRAASASPTVVAHDLHIAYADMAIEGAVVAGRVRMFKDDLERALGPMVGADAFTLRAGSEADALVMRYLADHLTIEVAGATLEPTLVRSGQDMLDREPVWWVIVQYQATAAIDTLRVSNTLLFDVFDDQRNIMKFVRFPEERQKTFYFDEDEAEHVVTY